MNPKSSTRRLAILVVDDDPLFTSLVEARLASLQCDCRCVGEGREALSLARTQSIDAAIVDFEMPNLDGIALIRCLRSCAQTRHIPIVMCTARTDVYSMQDALDAGASSFLTKPVNWSLFERHISHLLDLSRQTVETSHALERAQEELFDMKSSISEFLSEIETVLNDPRRLALGIPEIERLRACVGRLASAHFDGAPDSSLPCDGEPKPKDIAVASHR